MGDFVSFYWIFCQAHLYGHNPTLQPVQLQRPQVGGDVGRVGLAAEQVEAEYKFLISQGRQ